MGGGPGYWCERWSSWWAAAILFSMDAGGCLLEHRLEPLSVYNLAAIRCVCVTV